MEIFRIVRRDKPQFFSPYSWKIAHCLTAFTKFLPLRNWINCIVIRLRCKARNFGMCYWPYYIAYPNVYEHFHEKTAFNAKNNFLMHILAGNNFGNSINSYHIHIHMYMSISTKNRIYYKKNSLVYVSAGNYFERGVFPLFYVLWKAGMFFLRNIHVECRGGGKFQKKCHSKIGLLWFWVIQNCSWIYIRIFYCWRGEGENGAPPGYARDGHMYTTGYWVCTLWCFVRGIDRTTLLFFLPMWSCTYTLPCRRHYTKTRF